MTKSRYNKKGVVLAGLLGLFSANASASQEMYGPDYPGVKFTQDIFGEDRLYF